MPTLKINAGCMPFRQRGVAAVELALVIIPLLLIVAGIVEFGRAFWYYDALVKSTRDAARYVSNTRVSPSVTVNDDIKNNAKEMVRVAVNAARVPGFSSTYVSVVCDPADCVAAEYVTVSIVDYPLTIGGLIPIIGPNGTSTWSATFSPATTMRYMQ